MTHPEITKAEATGRGFNHESPREKERKITAGFDYTCGGCGSGFQEGFFTGPFWNEALKCVVGSCCVGKDKNDLSN